MTDCPVCSRPMPPVPPWRERLRVTCGFHCGGVMRERRKRAAEQAEVDAAAVLRLQLGQPVTSTRAERLQATDTLTRRGLTLAQVAERLHVTPRAISRYRAELRKETNAVTK